MLVTAIHCKMIQLYIYMHSFFFLILFHYGLPQDTEYSSLCYKEYLVAYLLLIYRGEEDQN